MTTPHLVEYAEASPEIRALYDEIKQGLNMTDVPNFWKCLANHPATALRIHELAKAVMSPGAVDALTKEFVYLAVAVMANCEICVRVHTKLARDKGATDEQIGEVFSVISLAAGNAALANAWRVPIDEQFA